MNKSPIIISRPFQNIPMPEKVKKIESKERKCRYPLKDMEIGDSFKVSYNKKKNSKFKLQSTIIRADIVTTAKRQGLNFKFTIRSLETDNPDLVVFGIWRVK